MRMPNARHINKMIAEKKYTWSAKSQPYRQSWESIIKCPRYEKQAYNKPILSKTKIYTSNKEIWNLTPGIVKIRLTSPSISGGNGSLRSSHPLLLPRPRKSIYIYIYVCVCVGWKLKQPGNFSQKRFPLYSLHFTSIKGRRVFKFFSSHACGIINIALNNEFITRQLTSLLVYLTFLIYLSYLFSLFVLPLLY